MSLEMLNGIKKIGGFEITGGVSNFGSNRPILVNHDENQLAFKIQTGPIKEVGVNGCQVDTVIETAKIILEEFNKKVPCRENSVAITKLDEALHWLEHRKKNSEARDVEGTAQA